jgi:hypothetical protein
MTIEKATPPLELPSRSDQNAQRSTLSQEANLDTPFTNSLVEYTSDKYL